MEKLKANLIKLGYRYFLYDNSQHLQNGNEIIHYTLHPGTEYILLGSSAILLESDPGEEILKEFLSGQSQIHLFIGSTLRVNKHGVLYIHEEFKSLKENKL